MALTTTEEALVRQLLDQQAAILSLASSESTIISKLGATKVTIADLPGAGSIADADLFLIRQGTQEKNVTGAVVKALASASVGGATEATAGIVELATAAETQTGTDNSRAVHPAGLASLTATETRSGLVELANTSETMAGVDAARAVTPAGAKAAYGVSTITSAVLANNATQTIAHSLSAAPKNVTYSLLVETASAGWSVGDEIYRWVDGLTSVTDSTISIGSDSTNFFIVTSTSNVAILNKSTGAGASVPVANFKVRIKYN